MPRKRTASSGSRVPPAVTSTRLPGQRAPAGASSSSTRAAISSGSAIRPTPHSPSASSPSSGPTSSTPRAREQRRRSPASPGAPTCAGSSPARRAAGPRCASAASVSTLSASPCASLASVFAVQRRDDEQVGARRGAGRDRSRGGRARERVEGLGARRTARRRGVTSGTTSCPALTSSRDELAGLVRRDAAGHAEQDPRHRRLCRPRRRTRRGCRRRSP